MTEKSKSAYELANDERNIEQQLRHGRELHDYAVGKTIVRLISGMVPCFKTTGVSPLNPGIPAIKS